MIRSNEPLSMAEALGYIKGDKDVEVEVKGFIKKFVKLKPAEAKEMREKLEALDLLKLKAEYISKIIDLMPENNEELNKIFTDVSLDEDETKKILDIVKEYK
jgi:DNA-directed RNA polymerase subunit F